MLKALFEKDEDEKIIILGLSEENIKRLKLNQPIYIDLDQSMGIKTFKIFIFTGKDEEEMQKDLKKNLLGEDVEFINMPNKTH